ncbi:conserved unknown protein [Ectocarpus siliculosus]|uniref:Choline transporter-like protein n=1 Tax=Ectocarpus siliculosus TaxID=2880 RepID=D7FHM5_ECTSI|nr:conserved unknown protein [Ectocarpus siliculosus]|eukprot:CBJ28582.1 conserved unknown protein [Ectocarpus siliculosus]
MGVAMIAVGWGVLRMALNSFANFPKRMVQATFMGVAGVSGVAAAAPLWSALLKKALITWVVWEVSCILCILCCIMFWHQIHLRFGAADLNVAALAVRSMPGTIYLALFMGAMRVVWFMLSALSAVGSFVAFSPVVVSADGTTYSFLGCQDIVVSSSPYGGGEATTGSGLSCHCGGEVISSDSGCEFSGGGFQRWVLGVFWVGSFIWGLDVLHDVVLATVAGSVASWWFSPGDTNSVRGAFYRATHSSFGSLCKACPTQMADTWGVISRSVRISNSTGPNSAHVFSSRNWMSFSRNLGAVCHAYIYAICFIGMYGLDFSEGAAPHPICPWAAHGYPIACPWAQPGSHSWFGVSSHVEHRTLGL